MLNTALSPWPSFTREEADAVSKVLLSNKVNYWTGSECREFEKEFAAFAGTRYAVALSNGTLALDAALKAIGIGAGDDVIVTSRTFLASASCIVNAGANPVFADVDLNSQNISAETVKAVLTPNTKAVIVVHLAGMPAEMDGIMALAKEHDLWVIEDCAQAHGATYKGKSVGSIGHVGAWSFCQDKIITTGGEGGMVTTNDKTLWEKMWAYKDHGKSYDAVYHREHAPGFRWLHESFDTNWRMMEMQAVIGRIQLKHLPEWTARRQENAAKLAESLRKFKSIRLIEVAGYIGHAQYKFYAFVKPEHLKDGLDARPHRQRTERAQRPLLSRRLLRSVFGKSLRQHAVAAQRAAEKRRRTGRHRPDVLGAPDADRRRNRVLQKTHRSRPDRSRTITLQTAYAA